MKRALVAALMLQSAVAFSCDNCNIYMGVTPNDFSHSISLFYRWTWRYGTFNELGVQTARHGAASTNYIRSDVKEYYATYELRGTYFFTPRLSTTVNLPYRNNYRSVNSTTETDVYGLGDPTAMMSYRLINSRKDDSTKVGHRLELGAGVKAPVGRFKATYQGELVDHDMQLGSGSTDLLLNLDYYYRRTNWGINTSLSYKWNTLNTKGFRYGDRANGALGVFMLVRTNKMQIVPYAGAYVEASGSDMDDGRLVPESRIFTVFSRGSLGIYRGKWSLTTEYLLPVFQVKDNSSLLEGYRFRIGLSYYFN